MKKYLLMFFFIVFCSACKTDNINSNARQLLTVQNVSMKSLKESGNTVYKIEVLLSNRSKIYLIKSAVLKADLFNKEGNLIASKLEPVRIAAPKHKSEKLIDLEQMPRRKLKHLNAIQPETSMPYKLYFYKTDFAHSGFKDKEPVSYLVTVHRGKLVRN